MERFVLNPRHWPRVPARCQVVISNRGAQWQAETSDVGPGGCQLVSPRVIAVGGEVQLTISTEALAEKLAVLGRVAWTSSTPPVRLGVAFCQQLAGADPRSWFERLLKADPAMAAAIHRVPERLPVATMLYFGTPPRFVIDFTPQEVAVLRLLGNAPHIADVLARASMSPEASSRAIFSLLARRSLVLSPAEAVSPQRWTQVLEQAEAVLPAGPPGLPSLAPPLATWEPPVRPPSRGLDGQFPPVPKAALGDSRRSRMDTPPEAAGRTTAPAVPQPASLGDRGGQRRPEAQALLDEAQRQLGAGDISASISLLRRALALSPRDGEISALLGQLAFRNRQVE
jgi:Tfp pilus assembly protein PilZ